MKKLIIFAAAFFAGVIIAFGVMVGMALVKKNEAENVFAAAMDEYLEAINSDDLDVDKIMELSDKIYSEEYYGVVEAAAKEYIRDIFVPYLSIKKLDKEPLFTKGLTKEVIEPDMPNFDTSKQLIADMQDNIELILFTTESSFSEEAALKYLDESVNDNYKQLFISQVEEIYTDEGIKQNFKDYAKKMRTKCNNYTDVLSFLISHNGAWHLEGDAVAFKTTALTNEWNQLLARIGQK